jgi:hypothetical protein
MRRHGVSGPPSTLFWLRPVRGSRVGHKHAMLQIFRNGRLVQLNGGSQTLRRRPAQTSSPILSPSGQA